MIKIWPQEQPHLHFQRAFKILIYFFQEGRQCCSWTFSLLTNKYVKNVQTKILADNLDCIVVVQQNQKQKSRKKKQSREILIYQMNYSLQIFEKLRKCSLKLLLRLWCLLRVIWFPRNCQLLINFYRFSKMFSKPFSIKSNCFFLSIFGVYRVLTLCG